MLITKFRVPYYAGARELLASFFMVAGFAYKRSNWRLEEYSLVTIPVGFAIVFIGSLFWPGSMLSLTWLKIVPYSLSAIAGTLAVFSLCKYMCRKQIGTKILSYIGNKTLDILTWHFLSFKPISLIIIAVYALPIARLGEYPVIDEYAYQGWWLPYSIIGVLMSLLIELFLRKTRLNIEILYKTISKQK